MRTAEELMADWPVDRFALCASRIDGSDLVTFGEVDHVFALASVTKLFTALATHVAIEEGVLGLDDTTPTGEAVDDLLAHCSGLGPDGDRLVAPRSRRIYSNGGYELLAAEVERRSGIEFKNYWRDALDPLGLETVTLDGSPAHGASGTVTDVHRGLRALAEPGLIAAETIERLRTPHLSDLAGVLPGFGRQDPNPWGLGPEIRSNKSPHWTGHSNGERTYGHFGASGTFCWIDPDAEVALSAFSNRPFGDWAVEHWPKLGDAVLLRFS